MSIVVVYNNNTEEEYRDIRMAERDILCLFDMDMDVRPERIYEVDSDKNETGKEYGVSWSIKVELLS